jgi:beta-lactamase regulating signal transducer with metallopeptidase domain
MNTAVLTATSAAFVPTLLDLLLKAGVLLALATLAALAARRASAALRHLIWTLAVAGVLLLPALTAFLPAWQLVRLPEWRLPTVLTAAPVAYPTATLPAPTTPGGLPTHPDQSPSPAAAVPAPPITSPESPAVGRTLLSAPTSPTTPDPTPDTQISSPESQVPSPESQNPTPDTHYPIPIAFTLAWALGAAFLLARHLVGYAVTRRLRRRAHPAGEDWAALLAQVAPTARVRLQRSDDLAVPLVIGLRAPTILLPAAGDAWPEERRRVVLLHELAHLRRRDLLAQALTVLACALYWPNPLIWLAAHRLRVEREVACDDAVLLADVRPSDYAVHLLAVAGALPARPLALTVGIAMAQSSKLGARIAALLDPRRRRGGVTWQGVVLLLLVAACVVLLLAQLRHQEAFKLKKARFTSIPLSSLISRATCIVSADGQHTAYIDNIAGKQVIVLDGKAQPSVAEDGEKVINSAQFDTLYSSSSIGLFFSPDSQRLAYGLMNTTGTFVMVVDGVRGKSYNDIGMPIFSPDSRHIAYRARARGRWHLVLDGVEGPAFAQIGTLDHSRTPAPFGASGDWRIPNWRQWGTSYNGDYTAELDLSSQFQRQRLRGDWDLDTLYPLFSPDSQHLVYLGKVGTKWQAVLDGRAGTSYLSIRYLAFSPDSRHLTYIALRDTKPSRIIVTDDKEGTESTRVFPPAYSPDSQRLAYLVDSKESLVVDGQRMREYGLVTSMRFSLDSLRLAAVQTNKQSEMLLVNGVKVLEAHYILNYAFSPDSRHIACLARIKKDDQRVHFFMDGVERPYNSDSSEQMPIYSPDSARLAYVARRGTNSVVILDGRPVQTVNGLIYHLTFSPDSNHILYEVWERGENKAPYVSIDGIPGPPYYCLWPAAVTRPVGINTPVIPASPLYFDAPDRCHYYVLKNNLLQRNEVAFAGTPTTTESQPEAPIPTVPVSALSRLLPAAGYLPAGCRLMSSTIDPSTSTANVKWVEQPSSSIQPLEVYLRVRIFPDYDTTVRDLLYQRSPMGYAPPEITSEATVTDIGTDRVWADSGSITCIKGNVLVSVSTAHRLLRPYEISLPLAKLVLQKIASELQTGTQAEAITSK